MDAGIFLFNLLGSAGTAYAGYEAVKIVSPHNKLIAISVALVFLNFLVGVWA